MKCGGRLRVALSAADLLVRCPGFALVVVDLDELGPMPASAHLRLQRAVEGSDTILIIRSARHREGSPASLVLAMRRLGPRWLGLRPLTRLAGLRSEVSISRTRPSHTLSHLEGRLDGRLDAMTRIACLLTVNEPAGNEPAGNEPARPRLLRVALAHSPRVEDTAAGWVYLDASGLEGLFGDEPRLAARLRDAAASAGVEITVGIAESRIAALDAARLGPGVMVVEPGGDADYLAPAPLALLDLPEETATRLSRWGLRTLGELAALPTAGLFERLGGDGVRLQRLARGEDPRPLVSWRPAPLFEESVACEWGLETLEPVVERLRDLAARVCARLGSAGLAADSSESTAGSMTADSSWRADAGGAHHRSPSVGGLLRLALEARPPRGWWRRSRFAPARCGSPRRRSRSPTARAPLRVSSPPH